MKKVIPIIFALILVCPSQIVAGQTIELGGKANQESVEVYITDKGDVTVKHIVKRSSSPVQIDLIAGTRDNIRIVGEDGGYVTHAMINDDIGILFFPSNENRVVEYDLGDTLSMIDGVWTWHFLYLESTKFFFPDNTDMIFINGQLVLLEEKKAINCHGCDMLLEYFVDDNIKHERMVWEDHEFDVPIVSLTELEDFEFEQSKKSISFRPAETDRFITLIMPLELLGGPYHIYQNGKQIPKHDYITNGTHVWMNMRPSSTEQVTIIGTTVIPEFSVFLPIMILGMMLVVMFRFKNNLTLR